MRRGGGKRKSSHNVNPIQDGGRMWSVVTRLIESLIDMQRVNCENCQTEILINYSFCNNCGNRVDTGKFNTCFF